MQPRSALLYPRAPLYFFLLLLLALAGFFPSYFHRLRQVDAVHHFHGVLALLWMLLLIVQSWLIGRGHRRIHRILGWMSLVLVPLFLISGILVVHAMLAATGGFSARYGSQLALLDLESLLYFGLAYLFAIRYRRDVRLHARFMASTALLLIPPALARLLGFAVPAIHTFDAAFHLSFLACEGVVLLLILDDRRQDRILPPYPVLLGVVLIQHASFLLAPHLAPWSRFAHWLGAL